VEVGISLQRNILPNWVKGIFMGCNGDPELPQQFGTTGLLFNPDLKLKVFIENSRAEEHMNTILRHWWMYCKVSKELRSLEIHWVNYYIFRKKVETWLNVSYEDLRRNDTRWVKWIMK